MKGGKQPHGYTIVEVLIFLAVSSLMFIIAVGAVSGKQAVVEFKQGMNDINTQIRSTVNDVANGEFPSQGDFGCQAPDSNSPPAVQGPATAQGTNGGVGGCIFMGKVIQFGVGSATSADYNVYTVVGRQISFTTKDPVTTFQDAMPVAFDNLTAAHKLEDGLTVKKMMTCTTNCDTAPQSSMQNIGAVGFFGSLANADATQVDTLESGSQSVITASIKNSTLGQGETGGSGMVATIAAGAHDIGLPATNFIIRGGSEIIVCFENGTQIGSVVIGGNNGQQFTTRVSTGGGVPKACLS